jgi:hypothetical protein
MQQTYFDLFVVLIDIQENDRVAQNKCRIGILERVIGGVRTISIDASVSNKLLAPASTRTTRTFRQKSPELVR